LWGMEREHEVSFPTANLFEERLMSSYIPCLSGAIRTPRRQVHTVGFLLINCLVASLFFGFGMK
ncbi:MAG: hypothetical protein QF752_01360, partial [Planctomycetota bacterium]|nr:hypothetical protein [Planctomycetota bacterium]